MGNNGELLFAKGANISDDEQMIERLNAHGGNLEIDSRSSEEMINEAVETADKADVIVAVVGESQGMSGEAASRADIRLPGNQLDLLKALKETGKPFVIVLMNGRPLALTWEEENADAILETWYAVVGSNTRPVKELKGFQKIFLEAGETRTVTFELTVEDLKFYNKELEFTYEPGEFNVFVGTNSRDAKEASFMLEE